MENLAKLSGKLHDRKHAVGTHLNGTDMQMTEIMGDMGVDYVWIDTEHTSIDRHILQGHLIAARAAGIPAFVRVPWNDFVLAKPVLEMGPDGVIFPMVSSAEEAQAAVAACTYPPDGIRGFGPKRANHFGTIPTDTYLNETAPSVWKIVQIETRDAVEHIDEIASVAGVDVIALGCVDLSGSYNKLTKIKDPEMVEIYRQVFAAAHRHGKITLSSHGACGTEAVEFWMSLGADMITLGSDYSFVAAAAKSVVEDFRLVCEKK